MRILILDNTMDPKSWGSPELARYAAAFPGATVTVRRAPDDDLPKDLERYDRFIASGSFTSAMAEAPWISRLETTIRRILDLGRPYLGVCYGHQILCRTLGGMPAVRRGAAPEYGWTRIETLGQSRLFEGLPRQFYTLSAHVEEVAQLPQGMKLLARSEICGIQACELEGRPVFGVQFHPEKNAEEGEETLRERREKIGAKAASKELLHPGQGPRLHDPKVGETLFGNFLKL